MNQFQNQYQKQSNGHFQFQQNGNAAVAAQIIGQINQLISHLNISLNQLSSANHAGYIDVDKVIDAKITVNDLSSKVLDITRNIPVINPFGQNYGYYPQQPQPQPYPGQPYPGQWQGGQPYPGYQPPTPTVESPDQQPQANSFGWGKTDDTPKRPNVPPVVEVPKADAVDGVKPVLPGGVGAGRRDVHPINNKPHAQLILANSISPITKLTKDSVSFNDKTFTSEELGLANWINFLQSGITHNNTPNKSFIKWVEKGATINAWEIKIPSGDGKSIIHYFVLSPTKVTADTKIRNYRLPPKRFNELNKSLGLDYTTIDLTS